VIAGGLFGGSCFGKLCNTKSVPQKGATATAPGGMVCGTAGICDIDIYQNYA